MKFDGVGLKKDINNYYYNLASKFINEGMDKLTEEALLFIDYFYNDYPETIFYERTYDFADNSLRAYKQIKKGSHSYSGQLDLLHGVTDGHSKYKDSNASDISIRMSSWFGEHGNRRVKHTTPSPYECLIDFFHENRTWDFILGKAKSYAGSKKYNYLKKLG